ncbi:MAG: AAA family ATPase [Myxococcaceae bacterium]|nr:AAA family ATPase [Myxococcaceae bacterium]
MALIRRLNVQHFRSIRQLQLTLEPLTALVGPNGCGKSTILAALDPTTGLYPAWRHQDLPIQIERLAEGGKGAISVRTQRDPMTRQQGHLRLVVQPLRLELSAMRAGGLVERAELLSPTGSTLTNLVGTLSRVQQAALATELARRVPGIKDVDLVPTSAGFQRLRFHDAWSATEYTPDEVSDGTMLMLAYLALRFQKHRPDVITVEEPERGLHPYLLGELVKFLRELATGPEPMQVVLATHSPELLEHLKPEEVRFLSRDPQDGNVTVRAIDTSESDWPRYFREYEDQLGSAWLSGSLGGTPQTN